MVHVSSVEWGQAQTSRWPTRQGRWNSPAQGQPRSRNQRAVEALEVPGPNQVHHQRYFSKPHASPQKEETTDSISKMRKPKPERLSKLSAITQLASSGAGI